MRPTSHVLQLAVALLLPACSAGDDVVTAASDSGGCFVGEPGGEPRTGNSGYLLGTGRSPTVPAPAR